MHHSLKNIVAATLGLLLVSSSGSLIAADVTAMLKQAQQGDHRAERNRARDGARHPVETLKFFGWQPEMTVVEISPGAGWYTEFLAPLTRPQGVLYAANFALSVDDLPSYGMRVQKMLLDKFEQRPDVYDHVVVTEFSIPQRVTVAPPGSADMVLTFRNFHNAVRDNEAEQAAEVFYRTLKPGGILGLVDHRAKPGTSLEQMGKSGYVTEELVIKVMTAAGFVLEAKSEINANPADSAQHPMGVWSLPPSLRGCREIEAADEKAACEKPFRAIGESDRLTMRFRKPA